MGYADGHPVRMIGGRIALDFLNTADWTAAGEICHETLAALADLRVWSDALGLPDTRLPSDIAEAHHLRRTLRARFVMGGQHQDGPMPDIGRVTLDSNEALVNLRARAILEIVTLSALSILADPQELARVKLCPGHDCGWLFLDETRNSRRTWCMMETCGNRAKATRHYARRTKRADQH
jgi:predicted RNA-binding Zn ribbon-like protein